MAESVVAAINETTAQTNGPNVVLTGRRPPRYTTSFRFTVHSDRANHTVTVNPVTGDGWIRTRAIESGDQQAQGEANRLEGVRRVDLESHPMTIAQAAVPEVLEDLGLRSGEALAGRRSPNLVFSANVDGRPVALSYDLGNGSLSTTPEDAESTMTAKSFLQRLHLSRGYSPHFNIDSVWAALLDAMSISMVFWGLSGIFPWWRLKRTRRLGGALLLASLVVAVFLAAAMHDNLSVARRRGPRGTAGRPGDGGEHGAGRSRAKPAGRRVRSHGDG